MNNLRDMKMEVLKKMMDGKEIIIVDPENDYAQFAKSVNGTVVNNKLGKSI